MSLQGSLFAEDVEYDVTLFLKDNRKKREPGSNGGEQKESPSKTLPCEMGVLERRQSSSKSPERIRSQQQQQRHADPRIVSNSKSVAPAVEIYVPPPARRARNNELRSQHRETSTHVKTEDNSSNDNDLTVLPSTSSFSNVRNSRQRRPDRAVYVPRHRRSGTEIEVNSTRRSHEDNDPVRLTTTAVAASNNTISEEQDIISSKLDRESEYPTSLNINKHNNSSLNRDRSPVSSLKSSSVKVENPEEQVKEVKLDEQQSRIIDDRHHHPTHKEEVESVKGERLQSDTLAFSSLQEITLDEETCTIQQVTEVLQGDEFELLSNTQSPKIDSKNNDVTNHWPAEKPVVVVTDSNDKPNMSSMKKDDDPKDNVSSNLSNNTVKKNNESNNTVRRNMVSDVLIISDVITNNKEPTKKAKEVPVVMAPLEKKVKKVERPKSKPAPPPSPPIKISRDECDWDSLFDDNGDCLDPSLIEELTSAVGEVMIEQPKNDYKIYTKQVEVSSDEFGHVVEIYNFPSDFKTSDLAAVFSPFKTGGFELKWVDDTHCLGVFSSPLIAAEVLASEHPFVKTRPLSEATALSKTKARRSAEFLQPYRSRPETCAALARRLVTGALGVKLATARQEREHEKNILREAKEKRRLANKQREDAWEGIIPQK